MFCLGYYCLFLLLVWFGMKAGVLILVYEQCLAGFGYCWCFGNGFTVYVFLVWNKDRDVYGFSSFCLFWNDGFCLMVFVGFCLMVSVGIMVFCWFLFDGFCWNNGLLVFWFC